jgi:hypothetical protein
MAAPNEWRGVADLVSADGQVVVPVRVVLYYQRGTSAAVTRWWIGSVITTGDTTPDLQPRVGEAFTLRLVDGHATRVCLRAINPLDPRHPRLEPVGDQPLFARDG